LAQIGTGGLAGYTSQMFYFSGSAATTAATVTLTVSSSDSFRALAIHEYSGVGSVEGTASYQFVPTTTTPSSPSATPARSSDLVFSYCVTENHVTAVAIPFTEREDANFAGNSTADDTSPTGGVAVSCVFTVVSGVSTTGIVVFAGGGSTGLVVTNQTAMDFWVGPRHLPAGLGQTLTLDDTSDTSLYLTDDSVADALNTLVQSGMVTVTGAVAPFPRPTHAPEFLHGDGSPAGKVYAPQGSLLLRRDNAGGLGALFVKTTGVTFNTGWAAIVDPWTASDQSLGLVGSTFPLPMANNSSSPTQKQALGCGVWLNAGTVVTGLVVNYVATTASVTAAYLGLYNSSYQLQAVTANASASFGASAGWVKVPFPTMYVVPSSGLYYFAFLFVGTTTPSITFISGAGAQASQAGPLGQRAYFAGSSTTDTTLIATASPTTTTEVPWIGAY
jgi:hypothetical protein